MSDQTKPPGASDGLQPGDRIANFSLVDDAGQLFLFYEFAVGDPMVLLAFGGETPADEVKALLRSFNSWWGLKPDTAMIALHKDDPRANAELAEELDLLFPLLSDEGQKTTGMWFGERLAGAHGLFALILDRNLRILECFEPGDGRSVTSVLSEAGPALARRAASPAGTASMTAPVLVVPDVFPPELCQSLIDRFESWDPQESLMPTIVDGAVELAVDQERKVRRDVVLSDEGLVRELSTLLARRVLPELQKAFWFRATRLEQPKIVCYGAGTGGHFAAHRDNTAPDTAHRRFALTMNLNQGAYEGGGLVFPEYGETVYAPPTGGAIVFSGSHAHAVQPVTAGHRFALITFLNQDAAPMAQPEAPRSAAAPTT